MDGAAEEERDPLAGLTMFPATPAAEAVRELEVEDYVGKENRKYKS